jgi:hypothetical protein
MPMNWKDNYWYKSDQSTFNRGQRVKVIKLSASNLYPSEMIETVDEIGVVEKTHYSDEYGITVEVYFKQFGDFWNYLPRDLEKV